MRRAMCELMYPKPQKKKETKTPPGANRRNIPRYLLPVCQRRRQLELSVHRMPPCSIWRRRTHQKRREWFKSIFVPENTTRKAKTLYIIAVQPVKGYAPIYRKHTNRITHERSG